MSQHSFHPPFQPAEAASGPHWWRRLRNVSVSFVLLAAFVLIGAFLWSGAVHAQGNAKELRIGYQKAGSLFVLLKSQGTLEKKLAPLGVSVKWVEFPAGPQLLEGLNVGSIDVGYTGEAPPIFAQAAGAKFAYIGYDPASPEAEALVVPKASIVKSVADLKGKKIALNKGSNVHFFLVKLLEKNGLKYGDVQPVFLAPADARAAFEKGVVDAWVIWDPFLAAAEKQVGARILADARGVVPNYAFYLAERGYVEKHQDLVKVLFDELVVQGRYLKNEPAQAAKTIAPLQGLDAEVVELNLKRYKYSVAPLTNEVITEQQKIADTFADERRDGRLVEVLPGWAPPAGILHAVFPSRRGLVPAVRRFLDFLGDHVRGEGLVASH